MLAFNKLERVSKLSTSYGARCVGYRTVLLLLAVSSLTPMQVTRLSVLHCRKFLQTEKKD